MGASASVGSATSWSEKEVATHVQGIGKAFEGYGPPIEENALDGRTLLTLDEGGLNDWFDELEVKKVHRPRLAAEFKELQLSSAYMAIEARSASKGYSASKPTEPTRGSRKSFTAFLSHFKRECGTEARLVQQYMQKILPPEDDVFLDSGEPATPVLQ